MVSAQYMRKLGESCNAKQHSAHMWHPTHAGTCPYQISGQQPIAASEFLLYCFEARVLVTAVTIASDTKHGIGMIRDRELHQYVRIKPCTYNSIFSDFQTFN